MPFTQFREKLVVPSVRDSVYVTGLIVFLFFVLSIYRGRGIVSIVCRLC